MKDSQLLLWKRLAPYAILWVALLLFLSLELFEEPISIVGLCTSIIGMTLLFLGASIYKWVGYWLLPLLMLCVGVHYFVIEVWGLTICYDLVASILETNASESSMYFTWENTFIVLAVIAINLGIVYLIRRCILPTITRKGWICMGALFLIGCILTLFFHTKDQEPYNEMLSPISKLLIYNDPLQEYILKHGENYGILMDLPKSSDATSSCSEKEDLVIVFQFGESVMAHHLPMNGYPRNTMPRLSQLPKRNLVSYPKTESYACLTRRSAVGMLTDAELRDRKPKHSSFIDLFNKHDYYTSRFIGANESQWDFTLFLLTNSVQHTMSTEYVEPVNCRFDDTILAFREEMRKQPKGKKLFILYNTGAHIPFVHTPSLAQFFPTDKGDLTSRKNSYDNTIIDIDYMIAEIVSDLKDKNAVYFYFADHGMENKFATGGRFQTPVKKPACFIWLSDKYITNHPEQVANLHANTKKKISHDHLFHTILSLGGISSAIQKETLDLTKPTAVANPDELYFPSGNDE